jgi:hypothetical protein
MLECGPDSFYVVIDIVPEVACSELTSGFCHQLLFLNSWQIASIGRLGIVVHYYSP